MGDPFLDCDRIGLIIRYFNLLLQNHQMLAYVYHQMAGLGLYMDEDLSYGGTHEEI